MIAIGIGIGGDDHLRIADIVDAVLYAEGHHHVIELIMLVDLRALVSLDIEDLAAQGEKAISPLELFIMFGNVGVVVNAN